MDLVVGIEDWSYYGWDDAFNSKGIWINTTDIPTVENNTFTGNARDVRANPMILDDLLFDTNGLSVVHIDNTPITANSTWQNPVGPENLQLHPESFTIGHFGVFGDNSSPSMT